MDHLPQSAPQPPDPPKARLFVWCAKNKHAAPEFDTSQAPPGWSVVAQISLRTGETLESGVHTATSTKLAQNAACAELLALVEERDDLRAVPTAPVDPALLAARKDAQAKARAERAAREEEAKKAAALAKREQIRAEKREAVQERVRALLASPLSDPRATLRQLHGYQLLRRFVVESRPARGGVLVSGWLERPNGVQVHLQPFAADSRQAGEHRAHRELLDAIAVALR